MLQKILYLGDIVLTVEKCKKSKSLKVNLMMTNVMVSKIWQVTVKPSSKKDPCGIYWQYYVNLVEIGYK